MPDRKNYPFVRRLRRRLRRLISTIVSRPAFRVAVVIFMLAAVSSWVLFRVERKPPDGIHVDKWPYSTYIGTVEQVGILLFSGYDAEKPQHRIGYALTMFCMGLGIALLALLTADLASILVAMAAAGAGRSKLRAKDHIVIAGWHYTTRVLVEQLTDRDIGGHWEIVVVDEDTKHLPFEDPDVHLLLGDPTEVESLERASLSQAHTAIVPIDWRLPEAVQDSRTTLAVMAIKSFHENVYTCAEVLYDRNTEHLQRAGVNETVCVGDLSERLLSQAALTHGLAKLVETLLTFSHESEIYGVSLPSELANQSFRWLFRRLNKLAGAILISVEREGTLHTNPQGDFTLQDEDTVFVLAPTRPEVILKTVSDEISTDV